MWMSHLSHLDPRSQTPCHRVRNNLRDPRAAVRRGQLEAALDLRDLGVECIQREPRLPVHGGNRRGDPRAGAPGRPVASEHRIVYI
jgi:hypothetical protein